MIESIYQLTFADVSNNPVVGLTSWKDLIEAPLEFSVTGNVDEYAAIGAAWGIAVPKGGSRRTIEWGRYREHLSHAEAASFCQSHPMTMPWQIVGMLRVAVFEGESWLHQDAVMLSCVCTPQLSGTFRTLTRYKVEVGRMKPNAQISLYPGIPINWVLQNIEAMTELIQTY